MGAFAGGEADTLFGVFARGADALVRGFTRDELTAGLLAEVLDAVLDDVPDPARARTAERTGMRSPG